MGLSAWNLLMTGPCAQVYPPLRPCSGTFARPRSDRDPAYASTVYGKARPDVWVVSSFSLIDLPLVELEDLHSLWQVVCPTEILDLPPSEVSPAASVPFLE